MLDVILDALNVNNTDNRVDYNNSQSVCMSPNITHPKAYTEVVS